MTLTRKSIVTITGPKVIRTPIYEPRDGDWFADNQGNIYVATNAGDDLCWNISDEVTDYISDLSGLHKIDVTVKWSYYK